MIRTLLSVLLLSSVVLSGAGCRSTAHGPYTVQPESARNPIEAQRLTQEALKIIDRDPEKAERLLREALTADIFHGPSHNNLGVLFLKRGELFEAAQEFEWARKLLPGLPDPRLNLAMTLERAGRIDEAMDEYRSALEVYPGHIQTIQAMTRCRLRHTRVNANQDSEMEANLREIALRGDSEEWREWAQARLTIAPHAD